MRLFRRERTEMKNEGIVIIGGGLASQRCVETLRSRGYDGRIRMACGEPELPYDRPPLSKGLLAGEIRDRDVAFRDPDWYEQQRVELILDRRAKRLNPKQHRVELDGGTTLSYDKLLIATGSVARRLPPLEGYANVHYLRTIEDARRLRDQVGRGARLVIIGAGFIGQEVASTARKAGAEVTIVEALPAPLAGVLGEDVGRWLMKMHDEEGVEVRLSAMLESARGNGSVEELTLCGGEMLDCDAVVVGVGVAPAAEWLKGSGLETDGVPTDHEGRTALPDVFAAGDVATSFDPHLREHRRTEHWDAAARQGAAAAKAMLGEEPDPPPPPSFWSDQYGLRIQYAGHAEVADDIRVEGEPAARDFAVVYSREGSPVGALTVGNPRAFARLRKQIERSYANHTTDKE
jgi:NADPH-dependent 2,4-dienoyl-CoA reductase/sulfur reductase-like enzyme